jgi:hypothetical protein
VNSLTLRQIKPANTYSLVQQDRIEALRDFGNKADLKLQNLKLKNAVGNPTIRRELVTLYSVDEFGDRTGS